MTARIRWPGQDKKERTARKGQKQNRRTRQAEVGRTGRQNGQAEQDRPNWIGRKEQALQSGRIG
jgi:hypothetical protein